MNERKIEIATLSAEDAAAVDGVLERSGTLAPATARQAHVEAWLKVVGAGEAPAAPADLLARTVVAVQNAPHAFPAAVARATGTDGAAAAVAQPGIWRRRLAEFGAMAIAALLLVAVTMQGLGQMQRSKLRVACAGNLSNIAVAFDEYAQNYNGALPALAMPANNNWLYGNSPTGARNNSSNLIPLVNHNYVPRSAFYCPGAGIQAAPPGAALINELPPITYSYRNLYGPEPVMWDGRHETLVMADKNPLFTPEAKTTAGGQNANSPNHNGQGNYVMRADRSVTWETSPNIGPGRDNIWTVGSGAQTLLTYTGVEYPSSLADVLMAP